MDGDGVRIKFSALPQKYGTFSLTGTKPDT